MTEPNLRRLIVRWLTGTVIGTALVAITSPLFVRSYLPRVYEPARGVLTLPAGSQYRWRSEGYATTQIGPLGMPGKRSIAEPTKEIKRIALWGDSQAEGVSVSDDQKLFAKVERSSGGKVQMFPLARSGDDADDWLKQIPLVEPQLSIDAHVILIADLADLLVTDDPLAETRFDARITSMPAFLIQSVRNLITDRERGEIRRLRFSSGPVAVPANQLHPGRQSFTVDDWTDSIGRIRASSEMPIWIVYAPPSPEIAYGKANFDDAAAATYQVIERIAGKSGIETISVHQAFCDSARAGRWPHGFHNGQIGQGHLNSIGYGLIADSLLNAVLLDTARPEH